ncbi:MAG: thiamine phosphate synthase [Xanthobacteraceae bacterium]
MTPAHPRIYLVTPQLGDTASFVRDVGPALQAGDIAALLLRLALADERALINRAKSVAAVVQPRDVALLLDGHPQLAARAGADGAHLTGIAALTEAIGALKPDRIAGVGGLRSRHDAMLAGEAGADYVMFGDPDRRGSRPPLETIAERLTWWSELFELPCVGYAASLDEVVPLAQAGADFIALGDWVWAQRQAPAAAIAAAVALLSQPAAQAGLDT